MKPISPIQSKHQQQGSLGESVVATFFREAGWIPHPPLSGNDFGIDTRVEIVETTGEVTGLEFFVQVKTISRQVPAQQLQVDLGRCRVGTITYRNLLFGSAGYGRMLDLIIPSDHCKEA